jgi:ATP-binding protein involved in chromosome partitioning
MSDSSSCGHGQEHSDDTILKSKLAGIGHTYVILSGKGGVGKSTVAVNLAISLANNGFKTGLLDVDIHGPSVPKLLGLSGTKAEVEGGELLPVQIQNNLKVLSLGFLLDGDHTAVIWRGPMKANVIRQFFEEVAWGVLDCLVIDCPPGTGDEPLSVLQLLDKGRSSAIIVTTPQQVATIDVEKSITFCTQMGIPISGIIENMSTFVCPHCGKEEAIFSSGGGQRLAEKFNVPFLGKIPLDPDIVKSGDEGRPYISLHTKSTTAERFNEILKQLDPKTAGSGENASYSAECG